MSKGGYIWIYWRKKFMHIPFRRSYPLNYQATSSTHIQSQLWAATPISSFFQCSHLILAIVLVSHHICSKQNITNVIISIADLIDTYDIHHWNIFRSSFKKLLFVWFEPTTKGFHSDVLTELSRHEFNLLWELTLYSYSNFIFCSVFTFHFSHCPCNSPHLLEAKYHAGNHISSGMNWHTWYLLLNIF